MATNTKGPVNLLFRTIIRHTWYSGQNRRQLMKGILKCISLEVLVTHRYSQEKVKQASENPCVVNEPLLIEGWEKDAVWPGRCQINHPAAPARARAKRDSAIRIFYGHRI